MHACTLALANQHPHACSVSLLRSHDQRRGPFGRGDFHVATARDESADHLGMAHLRRREACSCARIHQSCCIDNADAAMLTKWQRQCPEAHEASLGGSEWSRLCSPKRHENSPARSIRLACCRSCATMHTQYQPDNCPNRMLSINQQLTGRISNPHLHQYQCGGRVCRASLRLP